MSSSDKGKMCLLVCFWIEKYVFSHWGQVVFRSSCEWMDHAADLKEWRQNIFIEMKKNGQQLESTKAKIRKTLENI